MYKIDEQKCIGCKTCELICPSTFKLKENLKSEVIRQISSEAADLAVTTCPAQAIIKDDNHSR